MIKIVSVLKLLDLYGSGSRMPIIHGSNWIRIHNTVTATLGGSRQLNNPYSKRQKLRNVEYHDNGDIFLPLCILRFINAYRFAFYPRNIAIVRYLTSTIYLDLNEVSLKGQSHEIDRADLKIM